MPPIGLAFILAPLAACLPYLPNSIVCLFSLLIRGAMARNTSFGFNFFQFFVSF
jgi:hypothetical protein